MGISIKEIEVEKSRRKPDSLSEGLDRILNLELTRKKGFKSKEKQNLFGELGMLLKAGIDIRSGLQILIEEKEKVKDQKPIQEIRDMIINGDTLSSAIQKKGHFNNYDYYSIKIGEESSNVGEVLWDLAEYYKKRTAQKRKLIGMFSYPLLVLVMAVLAIYFMLNFIVPMFEDVFKRFDGDLPALTKTIIAISEWSSDNMIYILLVITMLSLGLYLQRKQTWFRKWSSMIMMNFPVLGPLTKKIYMMRFCHSMHFLISSKNPLLTSLDLVKNMIQFYPYEKAITEIEVQILKGKTLHESMIKYPFFSRKMVYLIKVGEEVNKMDLIFKNLTAQYEEEVDFQMNTLGSLLEPILILFIGSFVAIILIAMYLPLFQLSTSVF